MTQQLADVLIGYMIPSIVEKAIQRTDAVQWSCSCWFWHCQTSSGHIRVVLGPSEGIVLEATDGMVPIMQTVLSLSCGPEERLSLHHHCHRPVDCPLRVSFPWLSLSFPM